MGGEDLRTAILGRYEDFEADLVVEILTDAGIVAFHRHPPEENDHFSYTRALESDRGIVMVDSSRLEEAKRLVAEDLPKHLASIEEAMAANEAEGAQGWGDGAAWGEAGTERDG